jgi:hypothetical protein
LATISSAAVTVTGINNLLEPTANVMPNERSRVEERQGTVPDLNSNDVSILL